MKCYKKRSYKRKSTKFKMKGKVCRSPYCSSTSCWVRLQSSSSTPGDEDDDSKTCMSGRDNSWYYNIQKYVFRNNQNQVESKSQSVGNVVFQRSEMLEKRKREGESDEGDSFLSRRKKFQPNLFSAWLHFTPGNFLSPLLFCLSAYLDSRKRR